MITIISGTNRSDNNSVKVARICQAMLKERGEEADILSLEQLPGDFLQAEMYGGRSKEVNGLLEKYIIPADKLLFVVPEYNGSISGVLKLFLDGVDPETFHYKNASLIGVSAGFNGNLRGLDHLTAILNYLQMEVLSFKTKLSFIYDKLDENGELNDRQMVRNLEYQMDRLLSM